MKWSLQIFRMFGIPVRVHITFVLLLLAVTFQGKLQGLSHGMQYYWMGVVCAGFLCVLVHELSHSLMARRFGVKVDSITLLPIGGVAQMRSMPREPWQEVVIALIGPVTCLGLAAVFLAMHAALGGTPVQIGLRTLMKPGTSITENLFKVNMLLAMFNVLPAFPLDGGRVLRGILAIFVGRERGTHAATAIGQFFAILLFFYGVFARSLIALVGMFIYMGAEGEREEGELLVDLSHAKARDAMLAAPVTFSPVTTIADALDVYRHSSQEDFPVVDAGSVVGILTGKSLLEAKDTAAGTLVSSVMDMNVAAAADDTSLEDVYDRIQQEDDTVVTVLCGGELAGIINLDQITKYDQLRPKTARR